MSGQQDHEEQAARANAAIDSEAEDGAPRESQSTRLARLAEETVIELFHTPDLEAFATYPVADHHETTAVRSRAFRMYLSRLFYLEEGAAVTTHVMQAAIGVNMASKLNRS